MPSIRRVREVAFQDCVALTDVVFGQNLERIEGGVFYECTALGRIAIPLQDNLVIDNNAFNGCMNLSRVDVVVGGIHKTISSLHMESWRDEMLEEIDRINQTLLNRAFQRGGSIQQWITRVLQRMEHYRTEHQKGGYDATGAGSLESQTTQ